MRNPRAGFQERERAFFDDLVARTGDTWWGNTGPAGRCRLERRAALVASRLGAGARVLELGCGAGAFTVPLLQAMPKIELHSVDISAACINAATRRAARFQNVRFITADILDLPPLGLFDAVVGNGILHHLPVEPALAIVGALLRPGGHLIFFEPNVLNPHVAFEKLVRPIGALLGNTPDERAFSRFYAIRVVANAGLAAASAKPIEFLHPKTPPWLLPAAVRITRLVERLPLLREFAGSLVISAEKPAGTCEAVSA